MLGRRHFAGRARVATGLADPRSLLGRAHIEKQADAGQGDATRETLRDTV